VAVKNSWLPVVTLLASSMLWGLTWLPLKHFGSFGVEGALVTLVGHGSVGLLALPLLYRNRHNLAPYLRDMLAIGFLGGLAQLAFASAMVLGDVMRVMALFYLLPAWGVLGGRLVLKEHIDRQRALSLIFALAGAFLIVGGPAVFRSPPGYVDLLAVASGLGLGLNNVLFRRLQAVPVTPKVAVVFVGSLVWAVPFVVFADKPLPSAVPGMVWAEVAAFGLIWILVATAGTLWAVNQMEAGRSSVLIIVELVTAIASAAILTGIEPAPIEWLGGALILGSALLEGWRPGSHPTPAPEVP
jgi:drug/metabolite transporter (DMT)-like permease